MSCGVNPKSAVANIQARRAALEFGSNCPSYQSNGICRDSGNRCDNCMENSLKHVDGIYEKRLRDTSK